MIDISSDPDIHTLILVRRIAFAAACGAGCVDADDVAQEVVLRYVLMHRRGEQVRSIPGWTSTATRNLLRDMHRRATSDKRARQNLVSLTGLSM